MRRALLAVSVALLAVPAPAFAIEGETAGGTDRTMPVMLGLIVALMVIMIVIGILEQRRPH